MVVETSLLALGQITENLLGAKKRALLAVGLTRCLQSCSGTASNHRLRCQIVAVKAVESTCHNQHEDTHHIQRVDRLEHSQKHMM